MNTNLHQGLRLSDFCFLILFLGFGSVFASGCSNPMFNAFKKKSDDKLASVADSNMETKRQGWLTSYEQAKTLSRQSGKPILMDFTGSDWCVYCKKLKKEVFNKSEFETWARENVVLLELDFPKYGDQSDVLRRQNDELKQKFNISSYPTVLLVDANENVIGKMGYRQGGPAPWIQMASSHLPSPKSPYTPRNQSSRNPSANRQPTITLTGKWLFEFEFESESIDSRRDRTPPIPFSISR